MHFLEDESINLLNILGVKFKARVCESLREVADMRTWERWDLILGVLNINIINTVHPVLCG